MSDTVVKLVPADPRHVPPPPTHRPALDLLVQFALECEDPNVRTYHTLQYVDAGEYEEGASCPRCGHHLTFDWAPEHEAEMDWYREIVHETEERVEGVRTIMPCCGAEVLFEEVRFDSSGFAKFELVISNPAVPYPLPAEAMRQLELVLGCPLLQVWAKY